MPPHSAEYIAAKKAQGHGMKILPDQAALWTTPRASDGEKGGPNQSFGAGGVPLPSMAALWKTPRAVEGEKGGGQWQKAGDSPAVETLTGQAFSHPVQTVSTNGETPSPPPRSLNPLFVEWLMGWPPGWTLLAAAPELTGYACSATAFSLYKRRMRSALFALGLPPEAPPAQTDLFG